jgi:hypothetical protein
VWSPAWPDLAAILLALPWPILSLTDLFRHAAVHVDKILRGTSPANIPIEQLSTFELAINLKTARALGITIPTPFLQMADRIIKGSRELARPLTSASTRTVNGGALRCR